MALPFLTESAYVQMERFYRAAPAPLTDHMLDEMAVLLGRRLSVYTGARLSCLADEADLSQQDLRALAFIVEFKSLSTGRLGQLMGLSHGGITALINRLESAGFIRRDRCGNDKRVVVLLPITERCEALMHADPDVLGGVVELAQRSSASELAGLFDFLTRCAKMLRQDTLQWLAAKELIQ